MGSGNSTHAIHRAGRSGDLVVVRRFLKKPAILNRRDDDDMTCLHWAAQLGQIDVVEALIATDAIEVDLQDVNGWTPLMHACCRGHKSVVSALVSAGASVEIESDDGRTALHRAATWSRLGPLDQLIEAGADVNHQARNRWTPLHCASAAGDAHACAILVDGGADISAKDAFGLKPVDVVADLTTTELVKRALTQGRLSACASQGSPVRSSRPSVARSSSPSPVTEALTSGVGADTFGRGGTTSATSKTSPLKSPQPNSLVGVDTLATGERKGRGENVPNVKTTNVVGVDSSSRGSWSRPIGPRPQPSRWGNGGCSGGSGGVESGESDGKGGGGGGGGGGGNNGGDGGDRGYVSAKSRGRRSSRSQRQVAVLAAERVLGSDAQFPPQSLANSSETDVLVKARSSVEDSENSVSKGRRPGGGSSGDCGASNSRHLCRSPSEDTGVVHRGEFKVVRRTGSD